MLFGCFVFLGNAQEPTRLAGLKRIFEEERAKAMKPLVEKYLTALEKHQTEATKAGELDDALAYRAEIKKMQKARVHFGMLEIPPAEDSAKKNNAADQEEPSKAHVSSISRKRVSTTTGEWEGGIVDASHKAMQISASVHGDSQGEIWLVRKGQTDVLIYKWTGKEKAFQPEAQAKGELLAIDVTEHIKTDENFALRFHYSGGSGELRFYGAQRAYRR
jgi:hypothetical protein